MACSQNQKRELLTHITTTTMADLSPSIPTAPQGTVLPRNSSLLESLLRHLPDMIWMKDPAGLYLACNRRFEEFFGAREADIVGHTDYDFVDHNLADFFRWHDIKAMNADKPTVNEEWVTLSNGERLLLETTKTAIHTPDGELLGVLGIGHDITRRDASERALRESSERYQAILSSSLDGVWVVDRTGILLDVNQAYCRQSGYSRSELLGQSLLMVDPNETLESVMGRTSRIIANGGDLFETTHRRKDGKEWPVEVSVSYSGLDNGQFFVFLRDISERRKNEQQIHFMAFNDVLTSLPNRMVLEDRLRQEIAHHRRSGKRIAVLFLDLDGFKHINDQYGHDVGDQLLIAMACRMRSTVRTEDTIARLGGDEFVAILPDLDHNDTYLPIINRLLDTIAKPLQVRDLTLQLSASIGVTFYPQSEEVDGDLLMRQADQAMYQAKLAGKNRYHLFDIQLDSQQRHRHRNLSELTNACTNGELELFYQPKMNMRTGIMTGVEALLRWHHPERGLLLPGEFLPALDGNTYLITLGEWTIRQALGAIRSWQQQGLQIPVSINIAGLHLQHSDFMPRLLHILNEFPEVPPRLLELEILETSALENVSHASDVIAQCRTLGISFALDDFGTGYSSLTYLKRLPTQVLKIDRSFVDEMLDDPENLAILDSVIKLATALKRDIVAEGVESVSHGEVLLLLGCEQAQGYAIARPMPASNIPVWLQQRQPESRWYNRPPLQNNCHCLLFAMAHWRKWRKRLHQSLHQSLLQSELITLWQEQLSTIPAFPQLIGNLPASELERLQSLHNGLGQLTRKILQLASTPDPTGAEDQQALITRSLALFDVQCEQLLDRLESLLP